MGTDFLSGCIQGAMDMVETALAEGPQHLPRGVLLAAQEGHIAIVRLLLERGAAANPEHPDLVIALCMASQNGRLESVQALLQAKVPAASKVPILDGQTALHLAACHGRSEVLQALLATHPPCDVPADNGFTSLIEAAFRGKLEAARLLLAAGADVKCAANDGSTALTFAQERGEDEMQALLRSTPGATPALPAATMGRSAAEPAAEGLARPLDDDAKGTWWLPPTTDEPGGDENKE